MSVIVTGIEMPVKCSDCKLRKPLKLHPDDCLLCGCPLKSVDGLIEKINKLAYSETEYGIEEFDASKIVRLDDLVDAIKEYCGMEVNNHEPDEGSIEERR